MLVESIQSEKSLKILIIMVAIFYLLALCPAYLAVITFPGASAFLNQAACMNFAQTYLVHAINSAQSASEVNYTASFLFTNMKFEFYNINFHNFKVDPNNIGLVFDYVTDTITMNITNVNLVASANFTLHWFGTYHGWTSFNFSQATFTIPTEIGAYRSKATFAFEKMSIQYSNFNFKFYSTNNFLSFLGYFEYIYGFESLFNSIVLSKLKNILKGQNDQIAAYLSDLPYLIYIGNQTIEFDYSPIDIDVTRDNGIQFNLVGESYISKGNQHSPYKTNSFFPWVINTDLRIQLTDYFFNTYLWSMLTVGDLNYTISSETNPNYAEMFSTTGMQLLLPGLYNTYGPNLPVSVVVSLVPYPTVSLAPGAAMLQGNLSFGFYVETGPDTSVLAFCTNVNLTTKLGLWFTEIGEEDFLNYEIYVNSTVFGQYVTVSSTIGNVDLSELQGAINWAIKSLIMFINPKLAIFAIKLPIPPFLSVSQGNIQVASRNVQIGGKASFIFS